MKCRVACDLGARFAIIGCQVDVAELSGKARRGERPVAGDWVEVRAAGARGGAVIEEVLPRRTTLVRRDPGSGVQVMAANVDVLVVVTAVGEDFSPRRVERGIAVAREGGAGALVVLNKIDRAEDPGELLAALEAVAPGVDVIGVSAKRLVGVERVSERLGAGVTGALIGSSGVGKSTLANALLGTAVQSTGVARESDDKGRHTTTRRELLALPGGGFLIDAPGIRELGLVATSGNGVDEAFAEIVELAAGCRFRDCRHRSEPGCAVRGAIPDERLAAYWKLHDELAPPRRRH
jgi:ribosome biogenesis GTPase / thiamine phosphate phosphatase